MSRRIKAYAIRVAMDEEHLPVALHRAEHVVAPQHDAPNVRSCKESTLSVKAARRGWECAGSHAGRSGRRWEGGGGRAETYSTHAGQRHQRERQQGSHDCGRVVV